MKAKLLKTNGLREEIKPKNGKNFTLHECYKLIECEMIEILYLKDGMILIVDEEGRKNLKGTNLAAMNLANKVHIVGNVILCPKEMIK